MTAIPPRDDLLDTEGVAALLGVTRDTVRRYKTRGLMPKPDATFGRSPAWRVSTIRRWQASRPGRTGRPRKVSA